MVPHCPLSGDFFQPLTFTVLGLHCANQKLIKMGTRGLLGFIILGQRHSAYKQYDSYPEGLGKDIVDFILGLTPEEYSTMARLVAELTWVPWRSKASLELQARYQQLGYADLNVSGQSLEDWYCLLRQTQGAVALPAIQKGELKHMIESRRFSMRMCSLFLAADLKDSFRN